MTLYVSLPPNFLGGKYSYFQIIFQKIGLRQFNLCNKNLGKHNIRVEVIILPVL